MYIKDDSDAHSNDDTITAPRCMVLQPLRPTLPTFRLFALCLCAPFVIVVRLLTRITTLIDNEGRQEYPATVKG